MRPPLFLSVVCAGCFQIPRSALSDDSGRPPSDDSGAAAPVLIERWDLTDQTGYPSFSIAEGDAWIELRGSDISANVEALRVEVRSMDDTCCGLVFGPEAAGADRSIQATAWLEAAGDYYFYLEAYPEAGSSGHLDLFLIDGGGDPGDAPACAVGVIASGCAL